MSTSVEIRVCRRDEIQRVMRFLHEHWAADHVLSWHQPLMDFQHYDPVGERYDFVLALRGEELLGVLGFIPTRLYDPTLGERSTCWVALWKVRDDIRVAGLGLRMLGVLRRAEPHIAMAVIGIGNDAHPAMYRALGFRSAAYTQHFVTRPGQTQRIVRLAEGVAPPLPVAGRARFVRVTAAELSSLDPELALGARGNQAPVKTARYFRARFLEHPAYDYSVHKVLLDGEPRGLIATRVARAEGGRALRIVDFLGEPGTLSESGAGLGGLLDAFDCEYADLWEHGLPGDAVAATGMRPVELGGETIVPNYFEPFDPRNGKILFAYKGPLGPVLFRADGDQDRPNRLPRPPGPSS